MTADTPGEPSACLTPLQLELLVDFGAYADCAIELPSVKNMRGWLNETLQLALSEPHGTVEVSVSFMTPKQMAELNLTYRDQDKPTNVLSFPSDMPTLQGGGELGAVKSNNLAVGPEQAGYLALGDIILCPEVVLSEAQEQGKQALHHWAHMIIHGALHLNGYDHIDEKQANTMESLEIQILSVFGMTNPYLARSAINT